MPLTPTDARMVVRRAWPDLSAHLRAILILSLRYLWHPLAIDIFAVNLLAAMLAARGWDLKVEHVKASKRSSLLCSHNQDSLADAQSLVGSWLHVGDFQLAEQTQGRPNGALCLVRAGRTGAEQLVSRAWQIISR
jgi:hypothetical protein